MSGFTVYPAVDVLDGRVVRLRQGDYRQRTRYADEPIALARRHAQAGARWLHLVDLAAARDGGYTLDALLARIAGETGLQVQTGGGVRGEADLERLLAAGAARVVVGSLAVREPERVAGWLARYGSERITLALDTRRDAEGMWRLPVHGWTEASGRSLDEVLSHYRDGSLRHVLCTDIERDGMLAGPNLDLYHALLQFAPALQLQASGGVRELADVQALRQAGCAGVVLGKALLEGRFELAQALAC